MTPILLLNTFFFNDTATTEIYTLSLHDALPIYAKVSGKIIGVSVLLRTRPFTMELVNLAVEESCQGRGVGKRLIRHAVETARNAGCTVLEVGTGNSGIAQLALYQRCGFSIDSIDKDFFSRHYREKIIENGIECRHMIRLKMELGEERIP